MQYPVSTSKIGFVRTAGGPGRMLLRHKGLLAFLCILLLSLISILGHITANRGASPVQWVQNFKKEPLHPCPDRLDWLNSLNIAYPVNYARRDILINPSDTMQRQSVSRVKETLFPDFQTIDLPELSSVRLKHCKDPLKLDVPAFPREALDASHVMLGISTTMDRLQDSLPSLLRWLPHTRARLFVIVIESEPVDEEDAVAANPTEKAELQQKMRDMGMDVTLVDPLKLQDTFSEKYFSLTKVLYTHRDEKTAWMSVIDDDTFFPSMSALVDMLAKYDPDEQYYVGALSENWWSVARYGMMAFGGAGVFLSRAMAEVIDTNYQLCKETSTTSAGDIRILECIYATTTEKLTNERDLHQIDVWSDLSGIFESGRLPLSLHHWKPGASNEQGYDLPTFHLVADVCRECWLQRWWFDTDLLLSNGYSISFYPKGDLKEANLDYMENTWAGVSTIEGSRNSGTDHSLGPTRPKLELDDRKIQYKLIASSAVDGGVRQAYLHPGVKGEMDSLLELFWFEAATAGNEAAEIPGT